MKARVKTLGLIVEVTFSHAIHDNGHNIIWYKTPQGAFFTKDELEFITTEDDFDYWVRLEHTYAGIAMQGMLAGTYYQGLSHDRIVEDAQYIAHALVEKYKKEEK